MYQSTLAIIKPHIAFDYQDRLMEVMADIISHYLNRQLSISGMRSIVFDRSLTEIFYQEHIGKDFFERDLLPATTLGPSVVMILSGEEAVAVARKVNGNTNPLKALPGTIRYKYGRQELGPYNAIHASDSDASARREKSIIFRV